MRAAQPWIRLLAAVSGALAVAMGAFAAHRVDDPAVRELLRTGAVYALVHAAAALALEGRSRWAAPSLAAGGLVFSASLYGLAFGAPRVLGAVTPLGGVLMILGWVLAGWSALSRRDRPQG
jgi:uncharacterized membrane protein YgdD (TMEM256/DUF423 family)